MAPDLGNSPRGVTEGVWGRTGQIIRAFTRGLCLLFQCKLAISSAWHWATSLPRPTGSTCRFVLGWRPADWVARNRLCGARTKSIWSFYLAVCPTQRHHAQEITPAGCHHCGQKMHSGVDLSGIFWSTNILHRENGRGEKTLCTGPLSLKGWSQCPNSPASEFS